ncbi:MAG: M23 family metallopeptidase [Prevotellaceae bacterium]|jgi:murein DD-endopeptidase MepM/ murein hydrolase activator NlpD|nr:M23 family metallopeptidase [Prevotellaceae bacterium]
MAAKYRFNPELLQFEGVRPSIKRTAKRVFILLVTSFLIAAAYYFVYSFFFDTPTERAKKRENTNLKAQLAVLNDKYIQLEKVINDISVRDTNIYRAIFEASPMSVDLLVSVENIGNYNDMERYTDKEIAERTNTHLSYVINRANREGKIMRNLMSALEEKKEELKFIPSIQPVENKSLAAAGASVGMRINPYFKSLKLHTGMDFAVPVGTDVIATADGTVEDVRYSLKGAGNRIIIDHGENTYETRYLYLNEVYIKKGQKVSRGQVIGKVGNLGMTVPHLHYEVRKDGKIADPLNYFFMELNPKEYERIVAISVSNGQSLD